VLRPGHSEVVRVVSQSPFGRPVEWLPRTDRIPHMRCSGCGIRTCRFLPYHPRSRRPVRTVLRIL